MNYTANYNRGFQSLVRRFETQLNPVDESGMLQMEEVLEEKAGFE